MSIEESDRLTIELSVNYFVNRKVIALTPEAQLADIMAMCLLRRAGIETGILEWAMVGMLNADDGIVKELVAARRWEEHNDGFLVVGWTEWCSQKPKARKSKGKPGGMKAATANQMLPVDEAWDGTSVEGVFQCWLDSMPEGTRRMLNRARRTKIEARLNEGYTVEDLCMAVKGWVNDPWPDRRRHNDVTVLLRDGAQVEKFRDLFSDPAPSRRTGKNAGTLDAIDQVLGEPSTPELGS